MADVEINGTDPSTYGWTAHQEQGLLSSPALAYAPFAMPDRPGARAGLRTIGTKGFQISGILSSTSVAGAQSSMDALIGLCTRVQPSTLVFAWSTSRRLVAECLGVQVESLASAFGVPRYDVRMLFEAPDPPFWEGTTQHTVGSIGSTGVQLPAGTAPLWIQVSVAGPVSTGVVLTLRNSTGDAVATMQVDAAVTSTEYLNIDMDLMTVYLTDSATFNTGTNEIGDLVTGDFFPLLPEYANYQASSWATLEASTGTATAYYHKRWY